MPEVLREIKSHLAKYGYCQEDTVDSDAELVHQLTQFTFAYTLAAGQAEICLYRENEDLLVSYDIQSGRIEVEKYTKGANTTKRCEQWRKDIDREVKRLQLKQFKITKEKKV